MSPLAANRLNIENEVLKKYFPEFKWIPSETNPDKLEVMLKTNSKKIYRLRLYLPSDYPNSQPAMVIIDPSPLQGYKGFNLLRTNSSMHILDPIDGHVQICHYSSSHWSPQVTLYKVILKGRLWLEAYENYVKTGKDIDEYLPHQKE